MAPEIVPNGDEPRIGCKQTDGKNTNHIYDNDNDNGYNTSDS